MVILLMAILGVLLVIISGYSIGGYFINGYSGCFTIDYWWLFSVILNYIIISYW